MKLIAAISGYSRRTWMAAIAFLVLVALAAALSRPVENFVRDLMMATISPWTQARDDIVLVTVTEDTLKLFPYRSPIDRAFLAELVGRIAAARPKAIGIDLLFDQATEPDKDAALKAALAGAGVPVVVAVASAEDGLAARQIAFLETFTEGIGQGLATLSRDPFDGVVRALFAGRDGAAGWRPGLAQALAAADGVEAPRERLAMLFYRDASAAPHPLPAYPAHTAGLLPPAWFAGKFVLIGVDLPLEDRHPTPFVVTEGVRGGTLPGIVIHAHALAQIVSGDRMLTPAPALVVALTLALAAVAAWLAWRPLPVLFKPVLLLALVGAFWAAGLAGFAWFGLHVPMVAPSVLATGTAAFTGFLAWRRDSEERNFIQQAFSRYVSPAVVGSILKDPSSLRLGGERREVTCVFTDLEGFTTLSESLAPERIASLLNAYLDQVCDTFVEHGATLDKLIGDAVVGFFGAPVEQPDQAERAVALALAIDRLSEAFRAQMAADGIRLGVTRVGVHGGPAIVGNFGGKRFFDYTAIGDTVNTAARLEGANKYIGTRLCVSHAVARGVNLHTLRPAGIIYLKGKTEGIEAFEPLNPDQPEQTYRQAYCEAYRLMKAGDDGAFDRFAGLARLHPGDRLVEYHHRRLAQGLRGADILLSEK
ncbi:MAG: hypothetical protein BroJett030_28460 [Alphaproteobacteria bacterium]|nr:MAG: hypothetical protein BroJett030_28460 [Alphaproteobacteria bacterium]